MVKAPEVSGPTEFALAWKLQIEAAVETVESLISDAEEDAKGSFQGLCLRVVSPRDCYRYELKLGAGGADSLGASPGVVGP